MSFNGDTSYFNGSMAENAVNVVHKFKTDRLDPHKHFRTCHEPLRDQHLDKSPVPVIELIGLLTYRHYSLRQCYININFYSSSELMTISKLESVLDFLIFSLALYSSSRALFLFFVLVLALCLVLLKGFIFTS